MVRPEGQAGVGDLVLTPFGEWREVVAVIGAGDLIEAMVEQAIRSRQPNYSIHSIAETCALHGGTSGREKRNIDRWKLRHKGAAA